MEIALLAFLYWCVGFVYTVMLMRWFSDSAWCPDPKGMLVLNVSLSISLWPIALLLVLAEILFTSLSSIILHLATCKKHVVEKPNDN